MAHTIQKGVLHYMCLVSEGTIRKLNFLVYWDIWRCIKEEIVVAGDFAECITKVSAICYALRLWTLSEEWEVEAQDGDWKNNVATLL